MHSQHGTHRTPSGAQQPAERAPPALLSFVGRARPGRTRAAQAIIAAFELSRFCKHFTRFTLEIFETFVCAVTFFLGSSCWGSRVFWDFFQCPATASSFFVEILNTRHDETVRAIATYSVQARALLYLLGPFSWGQDIGQEAFKGRKIKILAFESHVQNIWQLVT